MLYLVSREIQNNRIQTLVHQNCLGKIPAPANTPSAVLVSSIAPQLFFYVQTEKKNNNNWQICKNTSGRTTFDSFTKFFPGPINSNSNSAHIKSLAMLLCEMKYRVIYTIVSLKMLKLEVKHPQHGGMIPTLICLCNFQTFILTYFDVLNWVERHNKYLVTGPE